MVCLRTCERLRIYVVGRGKMRPTFDDDDDDDYDDDDGSEGLSNH